MTIEAPEVVRTERRPTAFIHLRIPSSEMQTVFGPAMEELLGTLEDQGVVPDGPVFPHHLSMNRDTFDFRLGGASSMPG